MSNFGAAKRPRSRRGATLVFVAILIVVFVGFSAFAVDLSRVHVGTNELQTDADAASLAGAMRLQQVPGTSPAAVATTFSLNNQALGDAQNFADADVVPIWWDPDSAASRRATTVSWSAANAVQVTSTEPAGLLFGRLLTAVVPMPRRTAIAWIANVNGARCQFKPWGIPIQNLFEDLGAGPINNRPLTQAEINQADALLNTLAGKIALTQILYPKDNGVTTSNETSIYWPVADNMNQYADQISGQGTCGANADVFEGTNETVGAFPGSGGGSNAKKAVDGVLGSSPAPDFPICRRVANDATCYNPVTGEAGIVVTTIYTGGGNTLAACGSGTCSLPVRMVAGFRLMCIFYGDITGGGNGNGNGNGNNPGPNGQNNAQERCPWLVNNFPAAYNKSYNVGTLVGYPVTDFVGLGSAVDLGSTPSLAQRLILVR